MEMTDSVMVLENGTLVMNDSPERVFSRWEELEKIGLNVPQITELMKKLEKKDSSIEGNVFDMEKAASIIKNYINSKESKAQND